MLNPAAASPASGQQKERLVTIGRRHRRTALAASLLAGAFALPAPARAAAGDIVFARAQDADSLDVARVSTTISFQVMTQIYDSLLNLDDKGHVVGGGAGGRPPPPPPPTPP